MRDEWFIRGDVPMTKAEVRAIALSKLELDGNSVLLDIGTGTGSVAVEAALCSPVRKIYAFEKKGEAVALFLQNREKAGIPKEKLELVEGTAPESFPASFSRRPTHAFIGGSSGRLEMLVETLFSINSSMRIVMNVVALETLSKVTELLNERGIEAEIVSVQVAKARKTGAYHLMQAQNPVYVISFGGQDGN